VIERSRKRKLAYQRGAAGDKYPSHEDSLSPNPAEIVSTANCPFFGEREHALRVRGNRPQQANRREPIGLAAVGPGGGEPRQFQDYSQNRGAMNTVDAGLVTSRSSVCCEHCLIGDRLRAGPKRKLNRSPDIWTH
jgi:hypothetical protein